MAPIEEDGTVYYLLDESIHEHLLDLLGAQNIRLRDHARRVTNGMVRTVRRPGRCGKVCVKDGSAMATVALDLEEAKRIVLSGLRGYRARVYLFGSWAHNRQSRTSDIDIAVLPLEPLPVDLLSCIRESLEESRVLYPIDLVDLSRSDPDFIATIEREGILWTA